ncbi:MAG: hypothetical protein K6E29_05215 [Cyanobacteria bacterium RUI128]|nr:hypothetical protein [Cyanobacteria bacterium RUI128]
MINNYSINREDIENRLSGAFIAVGSAKALRYGGKKVINSTLMGIDTKMEPNPEDTKLLHQKTEEAIKLSGMDKYGVNIQYLKEPPVRKPFSQCKLNEETIINGYNCSYLPHKYKNFPKETILMPEKRRALSGLHELGHAIVDHSKGGKLLSVIDRPARRNHNKFLKWMTLWGAFSEKCEKKDNKELSVLEKANNLVRDNAGVLVAGMMAPVITSEFLASFQAQKLANKLFDKKMAGRILKSNGVGLASYVLHTLLIGAVATCAVKAKDKYMEHCANR